MSKEKPLITGALTTFVQAAAGDGFRYIGIRPPLKSDEIDRLIDAGAIAGHQVEQVTAPEPACSLICYFTEAHGNPDALIAARRDAVVDILRRDIRPSKQFIVRQSIPMLQGAESSPFNPVTSA